MVESLRDLASFAAGLRLDQIPLVVQERALVTIADLVAANLAGSRDPGLDGLANDLARRSGAATVVGTPVRTTAEGAALFNGRIDQAGTPD
ncbi:MAG: MmgE/PrpD family protein [Firmicutes bacterium]|nr:MmgE/PrpD family protein [Bacillota bacterium]